MLENSYDGKGLRFGIIGGDPRVIKYNFTKDQSIEECMKMIRNMLKYANAQFIDFDKIDGLTIGEVQETLGNILPENKMFFVMYNQAEWTFDRKTNSITPKQIIIINYDNKKKDKPFDEEIEDIILSQYDDFEPQIKKYARCFLQRYRYGTKEKTDLKIMQYKKNNN